MRPIHTTPRACCRSPRYTRAVTFGFLYLLIFLGGFTLALVTGLVRRLLHPTELCDHVVAPSHEHWQSHHTPRTDMVVSFITLFGLTTFLVHGFTTFGLARELIAGGAAGLLGVLLLRVWFRHICDPSRTPVSEGESATVVRDIPPHGYGQVELEISGEARIRLAARSEADRSIPAGTVVEVLDRQESVVIVRPLSSGE